MQQRWLALLVALALFLASGRALADGTCDRNTGIGCEPTPAPTSSPRWDTSAMWLVPAWRLGMSVHRTTLPTSVSICHPYGKTCPAVASVPGSAFDGSHVNSATIDIGADMLALGPFRFGLEMSFGPADGPSTGANVRPGVGGGWLRSGGGFDLGLRFRGDRWAGYVEILPGFITMNADVHGTKMDDQLVASASGYTVGGRAGLGAFITPWLSISAYAGGAIGEVTDASAGMRLELRTDEAFARKKH